ncbi:MAG: hypothetical protein WDW38_010070 [Sanguina aurantia]
MVTIMQESDSVAPTEASAPAPAVQTEEEQQASVPIPPSPPATPSPHISAPVMLSCEASVAITLAISPVPPPVSEPLLAPPTPTAAAPPPAAVPTSTPTPAAAPSSPRADVTLLEVSTPVQESTPIVETVVATTDSFSSKSLALRAVHIQVEGSGNSTSQAGSASNSPSYLKPTAATLARSKKGDANPPHHRLRWCVTPKRRTLFSRIMGSTLLAPTANFLARMAGGRKPAPAPSSGGPRPTTRTQPFTLTTELRPKGQPAMSREEIDMAEAKEHAFRRNPVPKHIHESRELEFRAASSPKLPSQVCVPFHLASLDLHNKKQAEIKAKAEELERKEEEARTFKARGYDKTLAATTATAFVSASEKRSKHYTEVLEPVRRAREAEANKDKIVEDAATRALEGAWDGTTDADKDKLAEEIASRSLKDLGLDQFRKTLEFKAAAMPDFSSPFKPSAGKARGVTQSQEFKFSTDDRLGPAGLKPRDDREGAGLGHGVFDGSGYHNAFAANLRSSRNGGFLRASMPASPAAAAAAAAAGSPARPARLLGSARSQPPTPPPAGTVVAAGSGSMRRRGAGAGGDHLTGATGQRGRVLAPHGSGALGRLQPVTTASQSRLWVAPTGPPHPHTVAQPLTLCPVGPRHRSANYKSSATAAGAAYASTRAATAAAAAAARSAKTGLAVVPAAAAGKAAGAGAGAPPAMASGGESPRQLLRRVGSAVAAN